MALAPIVITTPEELAAGVIIPAWTTAEYYDMHGFMVASFEMVLPHQKRCRIDHLSSFTLPLTVKFTSHPEVIPPAVNDDDFATPAS